MPSFARAVVLAIGAASCAQALTLELSADFNRDGVIDDQDVIAKRNDPSKQALFLANIADTNKRCSKKLYNLKIRANGLSKCNDSNGKKLRNTEHLARFQLEKISEIGDEARGLMSADHENVRIFHQVNDEDWNYVGEDYIFSAEHLRNGLQLGIDSRDVRRHPWDGKVTVKMEVNDGDTHEEGTVDFELAPVLTSHVLQKARRLITLRAPVDDADQEEFVDFLTAAAKKANMGDSVFLVGGHTFDDPWVQDFVKPGYMSMPGPEGTVSLDIMMASPQDRAASHMYVFGALRDHDAGAVQPYGSGEPPACFSTIDSYGNLDTIPPFEHNGEKHPGGMPIAGVDGNVKPLVLDFLTAQGTPALEVDSGWLYVGHIDEYLQFLPDPSKKDGWILAVNDPVAGLEILKDASVKGHGREMAFSRPKRSSKRAINGDGDGNGEDEGTDAPKTTSSWAGMDEDDEDDSTAFDDQTWADMDDEDEDDWADLDDEQDEQDEQNSSAVQIPVIPPARDINIDEMLSIPRIGEYARFCASRIQQSIDIIKKKTGLNDDRIIRIPVVYLPKRNDNDKRPDRFNGACSVNANANANANANTLTNSNVNTNTNTHTTTTTTTTSNAQAYEKYKDWLDISDIDKDLNDNSFTGWAAVSAYPNAINGVVLPEGQYLAPQTWGPVINGQDILFDAVNKVYETAGFQITTIDDWYSHHEWNGDIHCGTNMVREVSQPWW